MNNLYIYIYIYIYVYMTKTMMIKEGSQKYKNVFEPEKLRPP